MTEITQKNTILTERLLDIGIALSAEKDFNKLLEMILTEARSITNADAGTLYLLECNGLVFKIIQNSKLNIFQGGSGEVIDLPPVPLKMENASSYVALTKKIVNIPDVYTSDSFDFSGPRRYDSMTGYKTTSLLVLPLENHEGEVIGVLQLLNAQDEHQNIIPFDAFYERIISSIASQAAISLTNMKFIEEIENLFNSFVQVMATAIDAQTPYNANHTKRVALLSGLLASHINTITEGKWGEQYFDKDRINQLVMAGWLHDIGKITTPLEVLNKSTRLDKDLPMVLLRIDYACAMAEANHMKKLAETCVESEIEFINSEWQSIMDLYNSARETIVRADNPGTFVDDELIAKLKAIREITFIDFSGNEQSIINESEFNQLSVRKGTLTEFERKIIEDHVVITQRMLAKIPFIKKLHDVPFFAGIHHELMDGKGYPLGLTEDYIPPEGRILALLDIFDALTASDRPYKKAIPIDKALQIIESMSQEGKIDKELLTIFINSKVWEDLII